MKNKEIRQKFTTTLKPTTIEQLEFIKIYVKRNNKRIRGLNEIIEIIVQEKWGEINDKYNKERQKTK